MSQSGEGSVPASSGDLFVLGEIRQGILTKCRDAANRFEASTLHNHADALKRRIEEGAVQVSGNPRPAEVQA